MGQVRVQSVVNDSSLVSFVQQLGRAGKDKSGKIEVDFQYARFMVAGGVIALLTKVHSWVRAGQDVYFQNAEMSGIFQYLQRMNFFNLCGIDLPERFKRRNSDGRFVEITRVGEGGVIYPGDLATRIASCIAPEMADEFDEEKTGIFDAVEYSVSELVANVIQHARAYGFAFAQYTPKNDLARIAIGDCGIGILDSFRAMNSPHLGSKMDDLAAIRKALEPKVSSKTHQIGASTTGVNAGVGLTFIVEGSCYAGPWRIHPPFGNRRSLDYKSQGATIK